MEEQERQGRPRLPSCLLAGVLTDPPFHKQLGLGLGGAAVTGTFPLRSGAVEGTKDPATQLRSGRHVPRTRVCDGSAR